MNNVLHKKDIIKRVEERLFYTNTKIVIGGNGKVYKRKYHLKYTQKIIITVLTAFFEVLAEVIEQGESATFSPYIKIEPRKKKGYNIYNKETMEYYSTKFTGMNRFKSACKCLAEKCNVEK